MVLTSSTVPAAVSTILLDVRMARSRCATPVYMHAARADFLPVRGLTATVLEHTGRVDECGFCESVGYINANGLCASCQAYEHESIAEYEAEALRQAVEMQDDMEHDELFGFENE